MSNTSPSGPSRSSNAERAACKGVEMVSASSGVVASPPGALGDGWVPDPSENETLSSNTTMTEGKKRPRRLHHTSATVNDVYDPSPWSTLATVRTIVDLDHVQYPEGTRRPKAELNVNALPGKFRYDRDFLMQFKSICTDEPDNLPPLDAIGLKPSDQNFHVSRGGSGRRQRPSMAGPPYASARQASIGLGFLPPSLSKSGGGAFAGMGKFSTEAVREPSGEESLAMASGSSHPASIDGLATQGGPGEKRNGKRSKRKGKRSDSRPTEMG